MKVFTGNPGKRPLNDREPMPKRGRPKCPEWVDDEAKRKWKALVPELDRLGILTLVDGDSLAAYCQAWAEFREATETLRRDGREVTNEKTGCLHAHPAIGRQRTAWQAVRAFAALFGLNPADRGRLRTPESKQADELNEFLEAQ